MRTMRNINIPATVLQKGFGFSLNTNNNNNNNNKDLA
jgi:hypothetical protein